MAPQIAVKEVQFRDNKSIYALQEEINMHKRWKHPHIVQYLGSEVDGFTLRIFIEQVPGALCSMVYSCAASHRPGGSLSDLLTHKWGPLAENPDIMADYTRQILKVTMHDLAHHLCSRGAGPGISARAGHHTSRY